VRACAELCGSTLECVEVGARAFVFRPGPRVAGGRFVWEIGTAGSATMLALGILPLACLAEAPIEAIIRGGIVQDFAPPPEHLIQVLAPLAARMGALLRHRISRALASDARSIWICAWRQLEWQLMLGGWISSRARMPASARASSAAA
jgi:RNA 3'-terminal phosphate cyclase (ATP)